MRSASAKFLAFLGGEAIQHIGKRFHRPNPVYAIIITSFIEGQKSWDKLPELPLIRICAAADPVFAGCACE
jgi:hypothetical protein